MMMHQAHRVRTSLCTIAVGSLVMAGCGSSTALSPIPTASSQLTPPIAGVGSGGEKPVFSLTGSYVMAATCVGAGSVVVSLQPWGSRLTVPCEPGPEPNRSQILTQSGPGPKTSQTDTLVVSAQPGTHWRVGVYSAPGPNFS